MVFFWQRVKSFCVGIYHQLIHLNTDLLDQIREVKLVEEEEALEMGREAATIRHNFLFGCPWAVSHSCNVFIPQHPSLIITYFQLGRGHYAKILEAVQRFNQKISNDFKIIEEAQIKMNAPPAL